MQTNRIRAVRQNALMTQARLAAMVGLSQQQIAKLEAGRQRLNSDIAVKIARALNVRVEDVLGLRDTGRVPVIGTVGARGVVAPRPPENPMTVDAPPLSPPGMVALEVAGDALWPTFRAGDVLFLSPPESLQGLLGEECVVTLRDGRMMLRRLLRGPGAGVLLTGPTGPEVLELRPEDVPRTARRIDFIRRGRKPRLH